MHITIDANDGKYLVVLPDPEEASVNKVILRVAHEVVRIDGVWLLRALRAIGVRDDY